MLHAAKFENAPPPDMIERVAEVILLTFGRSVARVQDQSRARPQQADRNVSAVHAFGECVGGFRGEHAIDPTLHHCRRSAPAIGMNDTEQITGTKLGNMRCDCLVRGRRAPSFGRGQKRIKTFCVKIMKDDITPPDVQAARTASASA